MNPESQASAPRSAVEKLYHPQNGRAARGDELSALVSAWFTLSAGFIFSVTGAAKIVSVFGVARVLEAKAPLAGVTIKTLMIWVGVAELILAAVCFHPKTRRGSLRWVAGIATLFLLYRLGLWFVGWQGPCGCMGNLTGALGLPAETAERIMEVLLAYLLVGSYAALAWRGRQKQRACRA